MSRLFDRAQSEYLKIEQNIPSFPYAFVTWFYTNDDSQYQAPMGFYNSGTETEFCELILMVEGKYELQIIAISGVTYYRSIAAANWSQDTWHHACGIIVSATDRRCLLDGGNKGTNSGDVTPSGLNRTAVGYRGDSSPSYFWAGMIAEAAIWDLTNWPGATASDKADNFEKILPSLAKGFSPLFFSLGLIAYWPLIRGLNDKVGGYNLTASGTVVAPHPKIIWPRGPIIPTIEKGLIPLSGTIAIESGMTGALKVSRELSGTIAIESGMTGDLKVSRELSGSIAIQSVLSGNLTIQKENVRWSGGLFTFKGVTYEIAGGESNKKFIFWDPNYTTMFRATDNLEDVLNCNGWIMCIGESGVASPVFARKLIHGGIIQAGTITAEFGQIADLAVGTLKIQDNAVTIPMSAYTAGQISLAINSWTVIQELTFTSTGEKLFISWSVQTKVGVGDQVGTRVKIFRNAVELWDSDLLPLAGIRTFSGSIEDEPGAGTDTYYIKAWVAVNYYYGQRRFLYIHELKK